VAAQPDQIDFIITDLARFTRGEIVALALNVDANLRESPPLGTPVDTGWARANWVPSVGKAFIADSDKRDPTAADIAGRMQEQQQGLNAVLSWQPADGPIFVTNNVPYIQALNAGHGHAPQSPPGFVQNAMELAIRQTYSAGASKAARGRRADEARSSKAKPR
jgi:hypothetical protein